MERIHFLAAEIFSHNIRATLEKIQKQNITKAILRSHLKNSWVGRQSLFKQQRLSRRMQLTGSGCEGTRKIISLFELPSPAADAQTLCAHIYTSDISC